MIETIATTLDHLREEISDEFFELNYLAKEDLLKKTKDNPAFFFITDAVTFAALFGGRGLGGCCHEAPFGN